MRRALERIEIPVEHDARERTWAAVERAFGEREPQARTLAWRPLAVAAAAVALVAAVASPAGRSVVGVVREAVGVERAEPALFALPAPGRILALSPEGTWTVASDGSTRLLGPYRDASWSPFGRFVVGSTPLQLVAVEPDGEKRWSLARRTVRFPRWGGSRVDTRIAYLSGNDLRVVGGDGRGDRVLARGVDPVAPSWRPASYHFLAFVQRGRLVHADAVSGRRFWSRRVPPVSKLEWSRDGELLLVQGPTSLRVYDQHGRLRFDLLDAARGAAPIVTATFSRTNAIAFVQRTGARSSLWKIARVVPKGSTARLLFSGPGTFASATWSPHGTWIAVAWTDADQWVFVPSGGRQRVRAVANVEEQLGGPARIAGWCCW